MPCYFDLIMAVFVSFVMSAHDIPHAFYCHGLGQAFILIT